MLKKILVGTPGVEHTTHSIVTDKPLLDAPINVGLPDGAYISYNHNDPYTGSYTDYVTKEVPPIPETPPTPTVEIKEIEDHD